MPSPFPGMDPYLESDLWTPFHARFAAAIADQLNPKLRPRYFALINKRSVIDEPGDGEISVEAGLPDVGVLEVARGEIREAGIAYPAPYQLATIVPRKAPHFWITIRDAKKRKLVTSIEILSPANKRGPGRRQYLKKRRKILRSNVHLLEIDLLRKGKRVPMQKALPRGDYYVVLCRADKRPLCGVWPITLKEPLPPVPVPLLNGDSDVPLDLQSAFVQTYDACSFDLAVDYRKPPDTPLSGELARWAKELTAERDKNTHPQ